jgi:biotin-(acetyl-CoA carboxylase) ligase
MTPSSRALDLPPPFRLVALREAGDAFAHASQQAPEFGAGTLVLVGRFDLAEFAVVLEPEEKLFEARRSFYAGMAALADALSGLAPPEVPITIEWPDRLAVGRRLVGGGRLAWPPRTGEQSLPDWLVFGAVIRLFSIRSLEVGSCSPSTSLADEGFVEIGAERLVEGFARCLMLYVDRWQEGNFAAIAQSYLGRLWPARGARQTIGANGNLRVERSGKPATCLYLRAALSVPSWLDQNFADSGSQPL